MCGKVLHWRDQELGLQARQTNYIVINEHAGSEGHPINWSTKIIQHTNYIKELVMKEATARTLGQMKLATRLT